MNKVTDTEFQNAVLKVRFHFAAAARWAAHRLGQLQIPECSGGGHAEVKRV